LPETHPVAQRTPLAPRPLAAQSLAMLRNPLFLRLALAGGFNFGALFLYIASAPVFVLDILRLNAQQFGWFFVPTITGMMLGSFMSGRLAGRMSREGSVNLGFAVSASSALANLSYTFLADPPTLPWAVLPMALNAFGIALVFPILTLKVLDMYPRQRGAVSSMQAVVGLGINALVAGLLSPLVSHAAGWLALASATSMAIAWLIWRSYLRHRGASEMP
jgi:MFS transporter, DHA1 family, multidrug resistance protein